MLGNGIKQTTTTTGTTLNLVLAEVAGYPTVAKVLPLAAPFEYTALDGAGLFVESGIGYLSDAGTMVRARICATFVGGVYNSANPTPANLTGTTTIICTPHAASLESMPATVDSQSTGVGRWLTCAGRTAQQSPSTPVSLRVYYTSFLLRIASPVNALMLAVTVAGAAGTVARCGLHLSNEKGYIGGLLVSTGNLDTATTGNKSETFTPIMLPPGRYVASCVFSGAPTVIGYSSALNNIIGGGPFGLSTASPPSPVDFRYETAASAVIPSTPSLTTTASNIGVSHGPTVFVGVV
jgi:hypothetical protein